MAAGIVRGHCPGAYGANSCDAHHTFKIVPEQYSELPLLDLQSKWAPLRAMEEFDTRQASSGGGFVSLELTPAYYLGPAYNTEILSYNGMSPPPIIRVRAGETLTLVLKNKMGGSSLGIDNHNDFRLPNTTNLHLHGVHMGGGYPGDDVKVTIEPGEEHEYRYEFAPNHMPGTHWYHPHFHGSTTLQTGQGVAGMIIVDDPDGYLPDPIANMPEINLMIQHMDLENLQEAAGASGSVLWKEGSIDYGNATTETGNTNLLLVNMQYVPKISVERGRWYRMRMVLSSVQEGLAWEAPEGCTLQLLAKDGIYLSDAPRTVETMILAPGNRADVAIRCDAEPGVYKMPAVSRGRYFEYNTADDPSDDCEWCVTQPNVAVLEVTEGTGESEPPIEPFGASLRRACYVADLTALSPGEVGEEYELDYGPDDTVNGVGWGDDPRYAVNYTMGTIQQMYLVNNGKHPHHQHVNPFQIVEIENRTNETSFEDWYRDGDWHDTLQHITKKGKPRIRWAADDFNGDMVFHCHILSHGDKGMMGQFSLEGDEGVEYQGTRLADRDCARNDEYLVTRRIVDNNNDGNNDGNNGDGTPTPLLETLCGYFFSMPWCP